MSRVKGYAMDLEATLEKAEVISLDARRLAKRVGIHIDTQVVHDLNTESLVDIDKRLNELLQSVEDLREINEKLQDLMHDIERKGLV
jgi:2-hydroxychromene-2-carboxylate isomerase|tara:strand:- start:76 stop:336 length:261 start_codon:yes stop_codon:yes gene_type:complete